MKKLSFISILILTIACAPKEKSAVEPKSNDHSIVLGDLQHDFNLNEGTREAFEEGLLLLHNFEYDDALTAFEKATAIDSTEVMGHWGEAMCNYKALWRLQKMEKGKAILSRLGDNKKERLSRISDPLEKDLWSGLEIMFGEGEFDERNKALTKHYAALHEKYPSNQEITAFYALSLIWATEEYGDGSDDLKLAASLADEIIKVNPRHPGALHYKIHALDGPTSAEEAHAAADAYAEVAASAAHALHMPSHIYLALGEWEGVVNSNRESYDASVVRMNNLELKDGARGYHSFAWLHYGLLQQGRYAEAENVLSEMLEYVPKDPTKGARGYLLGMQNRHLAESGVLPPDIELDLDVKVEDIGLMAKLMRSFLRAQVGAINSDANALKEEIDWLRKQKEIANGVMEGDGLAMCAAGTSRYAPTENSLRTCDVVIEQIRGMLASINGDDTSYEKHMNAAVNLESETNYPAGPPRITLPSFEQYGDWLYSKGRYDEAISQYDKALLRMPRRTKSLTGKLKALKAMNKSEEGTIIEKELKEILAKADQNVISMI